MKRTKSELNNILKEAKFIALKAGNLLLRYQKKLNKLEVLDKKALGVVSLADIKSENLIIKELKKIDPSFKFLGEEGHYEEFGDKKTYSEKAENVWIIDPLDGTSNFLSGLDIYCICLGLVDKGKVVLGVVYAPALGEMYWGIEGMGAFYQKNKGKKVKLNISKKVKLKDSLLVTGFVSEKGPLFDEEFDKFKLIMRKCRGIRRLGSAAMDMCYVSRGVMDGFWERGLSPWDTAAPSIIAKEAGLTISSYDGKYDPYGTTVLCCKKSIAVGMKKILKTSF